MRQKEWKLIITFHTTSDAIAFEKACKETGRSGRMIPVPRELSAGCGLAWCTVPADRADMETFLKECSIECEDMASCYIRDGKGVILWEFIWIMRRLPCRSRIV